MPILTQTRPLSKATEESRPFAAELVHYFDGVVDGETFEDVAMFLGRSGGAALDRAKGLSLWADELVILRDARGFVRAAHGFRYLDIDHGGTSYRLIYTVFSVVDELVGDRAGHLRVVAGRVYGRERARLRRGAIVWVTYSNYDPNGFVASPQMRRIGFDPSSSLPHSLRLYADVDAIGPASRMPVTLEAAIASLLDQRNQAALSAQLGESLLVPCMPSVGNWPGIIARHD